MDALTARVASLSAAAAAATQPPPVAVESLLRAIDAKSASLGHHCRRVSRYATALAEGIGLDDAACREIELGTLLHDVGKIGVADALLDKPGRLTPIEWGQVRRHPEVGAAIVAGLRLPLTVKEIVRSHHENLDGSGYPDRLDGEDLSLAVRIARVADALDAMTSNRPYSGAMPLDEALAELRRYAGSWFCPLVVGELDGLVERAGDSVLEEPSLPRLAA
jgi:putative two-component system response regulator